MYLNLLTTRFLITRAARAYGFLDPVTLLAKLRKFAQPSEVGEPVELLRAGMLFHARGLMNTKAIQNNLDWVWPYWVERQFNPSDDAFIPRAFSFSHINLTHRNWTAVGVPDVPFYPIVDPRGLITPLFDGWSIDFWFVPEDAPIRFPSKLETFNQTLLAGENLTVRSLAVWPEVTLESNVSLCLDANEPHCRITVKPLIPVSGFVAVALRPYNPEGISAVDKIAAAGDGHGWIINNRNPVLFDRAPERQLLSVYRHGDVSHRLDENVADREVSCPVGMATGVALFNARDLHERPLSMNIPIYDELELKKRPVFQHTNSWPSAMAPLATLGLGDQRVKQLYDLAAANLVLFCPSEVYPGPYTYKRFWFRDAAFILHAILTLGGIERTRNALDGFAPRQRHDGYFLSQDGEWDSNGEAIWMYHCFHELTGESLPDVWLAAVAKGARWISRKRLPKNTGHVAAGLLPAGFSAEHLGPNDYYYWDNFWGVAGLRHAGSLLRAKDPELATQCSDAAADFLRVIERSFAANPQRHYSGAIPAAPARRMDSGAVGSLVADYPLHIFAPADSRVLLTADYLQENSSYAGGFFQHMIHSGINAYLTLHLAQIRMRAGQMESAWQLIECVAGLASPTGQWPEAIHPRTLGGCMGDGQHIWAAAEWCMIIRNCFVREEQGRLIIASGLRQDWLGNGEAFFGPTLTSFGPVTIRVTANSKAAKVSVEGKWRRTPPCLEVRLPGFIVQERHPAANPGLEQFNLMASL